MSETLRDRRLRYARAILQSRSTSTALLAETSDLEGLRVLVLGTAPANTLCALMHTECRKAEARLPDAYCEARSADLVLAPHVGLVTIGRVVAQAARSLDHGGRIVLALPADDRDLRAAALRTLGEFGFLTPSMDVDGGEIRVRAERGPSPTRN